MIRKFGILLAICGMVSLAACGNSNSDNFVTGQYYHPTQQSAGEDADKVEIGETVEGTEIAEGTEVTVDTGTNTYSTDLFLITSNDMQGECLILEQLASGKQYMYYYSVTTRFLDKYGNHTNVSDFEPGRIICVGAKDMQGRLLEAQISDEVWEYPDVTRYSVDEERGVFKIADTNYSIDADVFVHSDGVVQKLADLTDLDTLRVVGIGKEILSVSVTTGHGELKLENTELFEGSFIQIGNKIFAEITPLMSMELPEGTYTVAVANNGYGGSTEIEIQRGQETVLDLDTLKGEGPKFGSILFAVDVQGAIVQIDGKSVDYSQPVSLQYGVHSLAVTATGYDSYSKKLFVNSEEATIVVGLSGDGASSTDTTVSATTTNTNSAATDSTTTDSTASTNSSQSAGGLAGSLAGSHSAGTTDSSGTVSSANSDAEIDAIVDSLLEKDDAEGSTSDYLSTITELLSALTGED